MTNAVSTIDVCFVIVSKRVREQRKRERERFLLTQPLPDLGALAEVLGLLLDRVLRVRVRVDRQRDRQIQSKKVTEKRKRERFLLTQPLPDLGALAEVLGLLLHRALRERVRVDRERDRQIQSKRVREQIKREREREISTNLASARPRCPGRSARTAA